jgi:ATP-dependent RNA helicase SUPV3L1/SUV3
MNETCGATSEGTAMVEAEATRNDDAPESAPAASIPDWADVRGFQVLAAAGAEPVADPETHARELAKELSARAARFAQSIDDSIVLASDGVIRWLGDPVARLVGGDDILKPRGVLLADEALSGEARESVETRLALWITAHVRKVLGPLEALAEPGAVADPARELARRVVEALGVLERERVRQQVKSLDQSARSALRKLGVRFGAFYIFVPALLKPGARTLCSQLWSLRRGAEPGSERLLAFAASGRTSFAAEAPLSGETYRVAGFRLCGDRVVRVDIVERLTDLIRAAIPDHMRPGGRPPSDAYGFVISPQMTSLTGCAGESFASILRSLGFESHKVRKTDHEAATRKAPTEPIAPVVTEHSVVAEASAEPSEAHESETAVDAETPSVEAAPEPEGIETAQAPEAVEAMTGPEAVEAAAPPPAEIESAPSEPAEPSPIEEPPVLEPADAGEQVPVAEADGSAEASVVVEEEWVEIWRPGPRRRTEPTPRRSAPDGEGAARPQRPQRDSRRFQGRDRDAAPRQAPDAIADASAPAPGEAPREPRRHEGGRAHRQDGRRPHPFKGARNDEGRSPDASRGGKDAAHAPPKKEPRAQPVDMDSPFAKLLALKPLLERRDKRT